MKREVPFAQFCPLEAPCAYAASRNALILNPSPALHLTARPQNTELCNEIHFQQARGEVTHTSLQFMANADNLLQLSLIFFTSAL